MTLNTLELPVREQKGGVSTKAKQDVVFGRPLLDQFLLDPAYHNLNQGMH